MKMNKSILAAALVAAVALDLNAGTVYMTGSTAMRGVVYNTIRAPGAVFTAAPCRSLERRVATRYRER